MLDASDIMGELSIFTLSLLLVLIVAGTPVSIAQDSGDRPCMPCHEDVYAEAASGPYLHSVAAEDCEVCHTSGDSGDTGEDILARTIVIGTEQVISLGELPETSEYTLKALLRDSDEKESESAVITIIPEEIPRISHPSIQKVSNVIVKEIKKGPYVQATISWDTDVFATSEIQYASGKEKHPDVFSPDETFTKQHTVFLPGLKHKSSYRFHVLSRDLHGNVQKSDGHTLNTAGEVSILKSGERKKSPLPNIDHIEVFRVKQEESDEDDEPEKENNNFYVLINANKPSLLTLSIRESTNPRNQVPEGPHGSGLAPERYSSMEVCFECHVQNASHPVGMTSYGSKTTIPDDLPTIEDGVMTCVTCHYPHGGDKPYFARLNFNKEICIQCHIKGRYAR